MGSSGSGAMAWTCDTIVIIVQCSGPAIHLASESIRERRGTGPVSAIVIGEEIVRSLDGTCHIGAVRAIFDVELRCEQLRIELVDSVASGGNTQDVHGFT
jgi:hypothetical protein